MRKHGHSTRPAHTQRRTSRRKWSGQVTETSDAMTLEPRVFLKGPEGVARSVKRSAERSTRRKASPFQSAMSMLNFYINRAGKNLSASRLQTLERAKGALRQLFGRPVHA